MERQQTQANEEAGGPFAGLGAIARSAFALLVSRLELAALELGEARDHLARFMLASAIGVVAFVFAVACWTGLAVALLWDALGWKVLLLFAVFYTVSAFVILRYSKSMLNRDKLSLPATMAELRNDRDALL